MAPPTKRRRTDDRPEEITFDPSARQEYLSGFHKRKQARIQNAKDTAAKREKEERVRERKQLREQRKEDLERHVTEVNAELKKLNRSVADGSGAESDDDEEGGDGDRNGVQEVENVEVLPDDEEYVDEGKYTTVTVEAMDGEDGSQNDGEDDDEIGGTAAKPVNGEATAKPAAKKRIWNKDGQAKSKKKKKFRYESKAERQQTRRKQKAKNHKEKLRRTGQ